MIRLEEERLHMTHIAECVLSLVSPHAFAQLTAVHEKVILNDVYHTLVQNEHVDSSIQR